MSNIKYKFKNQELKDVYYYVDESAFIISDRYGMDFFDFCEEYEIIEKIEKNEDGYFDFSKNLIDVGAEDGNYSILLNFNHNYCFEPNKRMCALIHANTFLKNKVYNTDIYNVGLGDKEEVLKFNGFCVEGCGSPDETNGNFTEKHEVQVKLLDNFGFDNIGLIKVDVEGMEEKVLRGGIGTIIRNNYPPILFECWDVNFNTMTQEKHDSLFNFLRDLGYEIIEHWGDRETHLAIHK